MIDPAQKAYVCTHVFDGTAPVRLVSRPEGDWCFLCGEIHEQTGSAYRVVGIGHVLAKDLSLTGLQDLAPDWEAERVEPGLPWIRTPIAPDA